MESFSFGSYAPGTSVVHRMDPRTKLLGGLVFLLASLASSTFCGLAPIAVFVLATFVAAHISAGRALRSLAPLLAIVVVVGALSLFANHSGRILWQLGTLQISEGSLSSSAFRVCRLTLIMCGMNLITLTTTTLDLTAGFERLLAPLARIGVPAHELGMMMGIALRFMPQFATEFRATRDAQVSRGARVAGGPLGSVRYLLSVIVPLFASVFRHAETLANAMDARCYHGEQGRTRLHPLAYGAPEAMAAAALAVLVVAVVALRVFGIG